MVARLCAAEGFLSTQEEGRKRRKGRKDCGVEEHKKGLLWGTDARSLSLSAMGETKVIYHLDEQETPYLVKISVPAHSVTLFDLKNALKKSNHKFFFKSMDADFG